MTGKIADRAARFSSRQARPSRFAPGEARAGFQDARLFGRVLFAEGPDAPELVGEASARAFVVRNFTVKALAEIFLKRRARAPIKAVLLMQERFPGIGNWMADEILWRAAIHPRQPAGSLDARDEALYREIRTVCREALRIIGKDWDDPPDSWLFNHRWQKGGTCPRTGAKLQHATIGGRTTCWSPAQAEVAEIKSFVHSGENFG
jgi:formamidopyrimidine-DNA glycosylase